MSVPSSLEQTKVEIAAVEWPTSVKPWSRPNEEDASKITLPNVTEEDSPPLTRN